MINPAKYYNPKPILSGSLLNAGVMLVSMNVAMGHLVALRRAHSVQGDENGNHTTYFLI